MKAELIGKPTSIQVYETEDYDKFIFLLGNRSVSQLHIKQLVKAINKKNFLPQIPIVINGEGEVIDGQHRLLAAKALKKRIYYIISANATLEDAILLNNQAKTWNNNDYFLSWVGLGKTDYVKLKEFKEQYDLNLPLAMTLLLQSYKNPVLMQKSFRKGEFKIRDYDEAVYMAKFIDEVKPFCENPAWRSNDFLQAVSLFREHNDPYKIIKYLKKYNIKIVRCPYSVEKYSQQLDDIVNIKNQTDIANLDKYTNYRYA